MIIEFVIIALLVVVINVILFFYFFTKYFSDKYDEPGNYKIPAEKVTLDINYKQELLKEITNVNEKLDKVIDEVSRNIDVTHDYGSKILKKLDQLSKNEQEQEPIVVAQSQEKVEEKENLKNQSDKEDHQIQENTYIPQVSDILRFNNDYVIKYKKCYDQREIDLINEILEKLDNEGGVSSVVAYQADEETKFLKQWVLGSSDSTYEIVSKVSLREHTFNVVDKFIKKIQSLYKDHWTTFLPKVVITGLLHDIGKLPSLRQGNPFYSKLTHQKISKQVARELLEKYGFPEDYILEVCEAVGNHHSPTKDEFTRLLKDADKEAREYEITKYSNVLDASLHIGYIEDKNILQEEFLTIFIDRLYPYINTKKAFNKKKLVHVFLFEGYIYFDMDLALYVLVNDRKLKLPDFFYEEEQKDIAKKVIGDTLRYYGYIKPDIKEPFFSTNYNFLLENGKLIKNQRKTAVKSSILELVGRSEEDIPALPKEFKVVKVSLYSKED